MTFNLGLSFLTVALVAFAQLCGIVAAPTPETREILPRAKNLVTDAPHWAIYSDASTGGQPPDVSDIKGFTTFYLSFVLASGPADNALAWTQLDSGTRSSIKAAYKAAGINLMISAFGATDAPTTNGADPVDTANMLADFVQKYDLDGVDVDYEDFTAFNGANAGAAEPWLISLTKQLRSRLPKGQYLITHAPIAAWFSPNLWAAGGYAAVDQAVGDDIDWYNLQFYSQNPDQYVDCDGLLNSASQYPGSALFEIASNTGIAMDKLVVGKIGDPSEASDYMPPNTLATCLQQAKGKGWNGGAMVWQYPEAGTTWIQTVRSLSWPF